MRKIEAQTIKAIRDLFTMANFAGVYFKKGNTIVEQNHHGIPHTMGYRRIISARLHGSEIFAIESDDNRAFYASCGFETNTTKSRLNVLMSCFSAQCGIYQKNFQWYLSDGYAPLSDPDKEWEGSCWLPSRIDADSYHWEQVEMLTK
jgi:hypothetical protein